MSPQLVQTLALIFAAQARVAGMQAENAQRAVCGVSMAYTYEDFRDEVDELQRQASIARELQE